MSTSILIFFGIAFGLVFLLRLARIGTLLAFLVAGVLIGPHVLGLWQTSETWNFLGEVGMMFLWFTMGLELNMKRLWQMKRTIFGFGAAQVLMVSVMLFPVLFGITTWTIMGVIMVSLMLAMSSTSSDLQILVDRNELQSDMGRQTFSILLFQDLLSIPLLAMLPVFAGHTFNFGAEIIDILVMSAGLILGVVIVSKLLLNPMMKLVAKLKSKEAFLLAVMLNIILWAFAFEWIGLPMSMGAFLAGMLISETMYRTQVQADIAPYQILFLSFFFIALGLGLNLPFLQDNLWIVGIGVASLILIKFAAIYMVARVRGVLSREASMIAIILAQGGEFGLLILQTMKINGINAIPLPDAEILIAVIIISMMMTPILLIIYDKLYANGRLVSAARAHQINDFENIVVPEVIICGFGRVGQTIAKLLHSQNIPYAALDLNVDSVVMGREQGYNVFYGDSRNDAILTNIGLSKTKTRAVVIALDNAGAQKNCVRAIRRISKNVKIFARARNMVEVGILHQEGVKVAMPETIESSFMLGHVLLESIGVDEKSIDIAISDMRANNYSELKGIVQ